MGVHLNKYSMYVNVDISSAHTICIHCMCPCLFAWFSCSTTQAIVLVSMWSRLFGADYSPSRLGTMLSVETTVRTN